MRDCWCIFWLAGPLQAKLLHIFNYLTLLSKEARNWNWIFCVSSFGSTTEPRPLSCVFPLQPRMVEIALKEICHMPFLGTELVHQRCRTSEYKLKQAQGLVLVWKLVVNQVKSKPKQMELQNQSKWKSIVRLTSEASVQCVQRQERVVLIEKSVGCSCACTHKRKFPPAWCSLLASGYF